MNRLAPRPGPIRVRQARATGWSSLVKLLIFGAIVLYLAAQYGGR